MARPLFEMLKALDILDLPVYTDKCKDVLTSSMLIGKEPS